MLGYLCRTPDQSLPGFTCIRAETKRHANASLKAFPSPLIVLCIRCSRVELQVALDDFFDSC